MQNERRCFSLIMVVLLLGTTAVAQTFVHPGINQQGKDLAYMKKKVLAGEEPWKAGFERLKAATDTPFTIRPHAHVLRGPYGKPNIGGDDLSKSANMAYNYALVWYISGEKKYADKVIDILNSWSPVLWDLDYNDAKLLAAWTGHLICNAAELIRYGNTGWQPKDIAAFSKTLMTVYFPLMRPYYPQANGNWDGAIIHSMLAIAVFTNNRELFNNAIDHFKYASVNGSICKYIYPNGQCQETARDHAHVQLGLGEFAGAAQVAFTQGVDLFSIAGNRIALGYKYEAGILLGEKPFCYCHISDRAMVLRDDYEAVYRQYTAMGVALPYVKKAADAVRDKASRSILTAVRAPGNRSLTDKGIPKKSSIGYIAGAIVSDTQKIPGDAVMIAPGQSIQDALDAAAGSGKWVVLTKGLHRFPATLKLPSKITLAGEGPESILFLDPASTDREAMINASPDMHDVTVRNLVIEASNKSDPGTDPNTFRSYRGGYNRGGILLRGDKEGQLQRVAFKNLTIRNATYSGLTISGATGISITDCDLNENGAGVAPGPKLEHNLSLTHSSAVTIAGSRMATSPNGSGISLDHCVDISVVNCEIARNGYYGLLLAECRNIIVKDNLVEANDRSGIMAEFLFEGNKNITVRNNRFQYNNGFGLETHAVTNGHADHNYFEGNRNGAQQKTDPVKLVVLEP